jgi:hypothetical protein|eukprot:COSAG01_NODE_4984_length_4570_cov_2.557593_4_plen_269_part_00
MACDGAAESPPPMLTSSESSVPSPRLEPEDFRLDTAAPLPLCPLEAPHVPTGISELDRGDICWLPRSQVVEIVGPPACGKTFMCCAASSCAARCGPVVFLETKAVDVAGQFRGLLSRARVDPAATRRVLGNIHVLRPENMEELLDILFALLEKGVGEQGLGMLVVDSFADLASSRVHGHPRENGLVATAARLLPELARKWEACVLFTNTTVGGGKAALKAVYGPTTPHRRLNLETVGSSGESIVCVAVAGAVDIERGGKGVFTVSGRA